MNESLRTDYCPSSLDPNDIYRALVEQLPAVAYLVRIDPEGKIGDASPTIYISPQVQDVLGFSRAEWLADPHLWINRLHPDDKERVLAAVETSNRQKTDFSLEYRAVREDGRQINIYNTARHLRGTDGAYYTEGLMFDITPQKRMALRDAVLAHCAENLRKMADLPLLAPWLREQLDEVLPSSNLMVALRDPQSGWVTFLIHFDQADAPIPARPPGRSLIDYVLDTNQSFHWSRPGNQEALEQAGYQAVGTPSVDWIGAPIPGTDNPIGVIALQIYEDDTEYVADDLGLLESIAAAIGTVLRDLQRAEDTRRQLVRDEVLVSISTQAVAATDVDEFLATAVKNLGQKLNVCRSYLFTYNEAAGVMTNTIEWCATGIAPQKEFLQNLSIEKFQWHIDQLKRGEAVAFHDVNDIPDPATRKELIREDIVSQIAVPLFVDGAFYGFIGFDECRSHRIWPETDVPILMAISHIITHVIEREQLKAKRADQMAELQRWHDITLGREKRVLELKKEINDLLGRLNEPSRYAET